MSEGPWIRFFPSDWLAGTRGMTAAETGIYITLISMMYERGEPIPNDTSRLARLCGTTTAALKNTLSILCDEGKISIIDGGLWNDRVGVETEIRRDKSTSAQKSAETRWQKQKQNQSRKDANALPAQSERNANQIPEKIKEEPSGSSKKRGARLPDDFSPDMAAAVDAGLSQADAQREALKFRDYWISQPGQKGVKLDWPATWRNWCRHAVERRPQQRSGAPPKKITQASMWIEEGKKHGIISDEPNFQSDRFLDQSDPRGSDKIVDFSRRIAVS